MIVPNQYFQIKVTKRNIDHFRNLKYDIQKGDYIQVPPEHLMKWSHKKILVQCDNCGCVFERVYKDHVKIENGDYCVKCVKEFKCKPTNLARYGVENAAQADAIKEKMKETNMKRYGVPYASQSDLAIQHRKETFVKKYGVESPLMLEEIREKGHQTNLKKYGVEWGIQNPEVASKSRSSWLKKNQERCSKQQLAIFDQLKELYPYSESQLNYNFRAFSFDIALFIQENIKIDIEYDGWYWHQDAQKDRRRDEVSKSYGWKILRIKGGHKLPTEEQLIEAIDKLVGGYSYTQIVLDDWKEVEKA